MTEVNVADLVVFGAVLVGLVLVGLISLAVFRQLPTVDELAKRYRLRPMSPGGGEALRLEGERDGREVCLRQRSLGQGDQERWVTSWELRLSRRLEVRLVLERRGEDGGGEEEPGSEAIETGDEAIETGDEAFDELLRARGAPAEAAVGLLEAELRTLALEQLELEEARVEGGWVTVTAPGLPRAVELDGLYRLAAELAAAAEAAD